MSEGLSLSGRRMVGYAVRWGVPAWIRDGKRSFEERFRRGAFASSIALGRVRLCIDHDWHTIAARQSDGSLRLVEDRVGLMVDAVALDTDEGDAALGMVRSRCRAGLSVSFDRATSNWSSDDLDLKSREVWRCRLNEISIVRDPAHSVAEIHAGARRIDRFLATSADANRMAAEASL